MNEEDEKRLKKQEEEKQQEQPEWQDPQLLADLEVRFSCGMIFILIIEFQ